MTTNLPFRFQAGSKPLSAAHHHRSTTKSANRPFKSKHASKGALKEKAKGRVGFLDGERKTPHQQVTSNLKASRKNQAKQKRIQQQATRAKAASIFSGRNGASRLVAVVPLGSTVDVDKAVQELGKSVSEGEDGSLQSRGSVVTCHIGRFKQSVAFLKCNRGIMETLETARMADYVLFVLDAVEMPDEEVETMLRAVESQGISTALACIQGMDIVPAKKRLERQGALKTYFNRFFPAVEKVYSLQAPQECLNTLRIICTTLPKGIHWREERPWLFAETITSTKSSETTADIVVTGVVRGKPLKADRLVQLGSHGAFQISRITAALPKEGKKTHADVMIVDDAEEQNRILDLPSENADRTQELADYFSLDAEEVAYLEKEKAEKRGVLIDDQYFVDKTESSEAIRRPGRLPRGTSAYQAAWYIGNESDSESDLEDVEYADDSEYESEDLPLDAGDAPMEVDLAQPEIAPSESAMEDLSMMDDEDDIDDADEFAEYTADDDLKFPDEIELHPNEQGRDRLTGYRGLKNFRTSVWDARFDALEEPEQWRQLLEVANYKAARNRVLKQALAGGVEPGSRVCVHIPNVPTAFVSEYGSGDKPLAIYQLLQHEGKRTALHFSITLDAKLEDPLESNEELLVVCGPRTFVANAVFSDAANTPNDVHKYQRYLHPGQNATVSFTEKLTWGFVPTLFFSRPRANPDTMATSDKLSWQFAGKGTLLPPSTSRVIAERIVLTGHPAKIHKRVATVRWMFFNAEDVNYFRGLRLWTKSGRSGFIKESLGTHGRFKAEFDGKLSGMEMVGVSLYKRIWPMVYHQQQ